MHTKSKSENLKRRHHLGNTGLSVDGRIILKSILRKQSVRMCMEFNWLL
jgi:hypothetical protein